MSKWTDVCLHERDYHMVTRRCELPTGHDGLHKSRSSAANVEWVDRNDCNEDCRGCWLWGKARGHHERQRRCPYCYVRGGHEAECRYAAGVVPLAGDDLNAEAEALAQELRERVATMQHALSGGSLVDLRTSAVLVAISADRAAAALLRTVAAPSAEQIEATLRSWRSTDADNLDYDTLQDSEIRSIAAHLAAALAPRSPKGGGQ